MAHESETIPESAKPLDWVFYVLSAVFCSVATFAVFSLGSVNTIFVAVTLLIVMGIYFILITISGRPALSYIVVASLAFTVYYADACVYAFRLTHIRISDFGLIGQALGVASHYEPIWTWDQTWRLILLLAMLAALLFVGHLRSSAPPRRDWRLASAVFIGSLGVVWFFWGVLNVIPAVQSSFDQNSTVESLGLVGSWYCQLVTKEGEMPDGYSEDVAQAIVARYEKETVDGEDGSGEMDTDTNTLQVPGLIDAEGVNVIVIMNESLADYSLLGETNFASDPLPRIHALVKSGQAHEGKLAVPVFGGGTCNTEWEFLTGHSMAFVPSGATPFLTYVNAPSINIASELNDNGYTTTFLHPYYSQEWNRRTVYDYFGFDYAIFGDDLSNGLVNKDSVENITHTGLNASDAVMLDFGEGLEYLRGFISDAEAYRQLESRIDLDDGVADDFVFCVTVQNHGNYEYDGDDFVAIDFSPDEENVSSGDSGLTGIDQYLTLASMSDEAFADFIDFLSSCKERTLVVMFGDHQPALRFSNYIDYDDALHGSVDEQSYVTPYIVWANYDIGYDFPSYVSSNYLSAIVKQAAGLPLTSWDRQRLDTMISYPVLTPHFVLDASGALVSSATEQALIELSFVQYLRMFES